MTRKYPLPLSSVVDRKPAEQFGGARLRDREATPQTATRNAQQSSAEKQDAPPKRELAPAQPVSTSEQLVSARVRRAMVQRLQQQGIRDQRVLAAMDAIPRHLFVDPGLSSQAYTDASLPIGQQQTISRPYIVARMIEVMRNSADDRPMGRVLEIGTGCGYQAAVLSQVAREVYSIERIKGLHELAKNRLRPLRIPNLRLHYGDGMLGLSQAAPFDGIILAAAGLEVPPELLMQLTVGGRLIAPVGNSQQALQLIERVNVREWTTAALENCHFVPLCPGIA
jgi:protein-L-isoaspartate(D-aspartate) O-methyltransferase